MFNFLKEKIVVATHNGKFHADDVFAIATLRLWAEKEGKQLDVVRTRDQGVIDKADMVVDVGFVYDPDKNRFDHHQKGGAKSYNNDIPMASFGLVWQKYGKELCNEEEYKIVERRLVMPIDARDNGINITIPNELNITEQRITDIVAILNPMWDEPYLDRDKQFMEAVKMSVVILERMIRFAQSEVEGTNIVRKAIEIQNSPEILILDKYVRSEEEIVNHRNIKLVITPIYEAEEWAVKVARDNLEDFNSNRVEFPRSWCGLQDKELEDVSGIKGALFCHRGGWIAKTSSKESAIAMAKKALKMQG